MNITILEMMRMNPRPFNLRLLKLTARLLFALDFLHSEAEVTHTGRDIICEKLDF